MDWIQIIYDFWAEHPIGLAVLFIGTASLIYIMLPESTERKVKRLEDKVMEQEIHIAILLRKWEYAESCKTVAEDHEILKRKLNAQKSHTSRLRNRLREAERRISYLEKELKVNTDKKNRDERQVSRTERDELTMQGPHAGPEAEAQGSGQPDVTGCDPPLGSEGPGQESDQGNL